MVGEGALLSLQVVEVAAAAHSNQQLAGAGEEGVGQHHLLAPGEGQADGTVLQEEGEVGEVEEEEGRVRNLEVGRSVLSR